jgi:hypothetical protein
MPLIKERLQESLGWMGEDQVKIEQYDKTMDGSYKLSSDLYTLYSTDHDEKIIATYILGCLIYHQLLYTEILVADYEP